MMQSAWKASWRKSRRASSFRPGPGTPQQSGICLELIKEASGKIPIFGVCLGLQAIGEAFGGKVIRAPQPMHGKVSAIYHEGRSVFANLPIPFDATRYHSLIVERASLPDCLEVTAITADDGLIMGLSHKTHNTHGVQFHPESIASEYGHELIIKNFLEGIWARASIIPSSRLRKPSMLLMEYWLNLDLLILMNMRKNLLRSKMSWIPSANMTKQLAHPPQYQQVNCRVTSAT